MPRHLPLRPMLLALSLILTGKRVDFRLVLAVVFGIGIATIFLRPKARPK